MFLAFKKGHNLPIHSLMLKLGWRLILFSLIITSPLAPRHAFAWGRAGHEEAEVAALRLLEAQHHPLSALFSMNVDTLKRVANVPDVEWGAGDGKPSTPGGHKSMAQRKKPKAASFREQGLHYFEVDAFLRDGAEENSTLSLPTDEYAVSYPKYRALLRDNIAYVLEYDRNQSNPEAYGSAPWRVLQAYDLATAALERKELTAAFLYLGVLGHYVADLAEPLNTTIAFTGRHFPIPANGVYTAFENKIFDFPLVEGAVLAEALEIWGGKGLDGMSRARVLPELLKLVGNGQRYIDALLRGFSEQCARSHERGRGLASADRTRVKKGPQDSYENLFCEPALDSIGARELVRTFGARSIGNDEQQRAISVRTVATQRLAAAAIITARLWAAAYNESGRPAIDAQKISFGALRTQERYFLPSYLPPVPTLGFGR